MSSGTVFPCAVRHTPVLWQEMLDDSLSLYNLSIASSVKTNLDQLKFLGTLTHGAVRDTESHMRDITQCCGLLLALHTRISAWPKDAVLCVDIPPRKVHGDALGVPNAAAEAVLILYNVAASSFYEGMESIGTMRAVVERMSSRTSGNPNAPSIYAKAAYKHFQRSREFLGAAQELLDSESGPGSSEHPATLTCTERQQLITSLDWRANEALTDVCIAVSKYMFSLYSDSVSTRDDVLAKLAFAVVLLPIPESVSEELKLLPTLFLAAYHRHCALHVYRTDRVSEMGLALGHAEYALKLLQEVEDEQRALSERQQAKAGSSSGGSWSRFFMRRDHTAEASGNKEQGTGSGAVFNRLADVFPLLDTFHDQVVSLQKKYAHENDVVYYATVVPEGKLPKPPVPFSDASPSKQRATQDGYASPILVELGKYAGHFDGLPSAEQLQCAVQKLTESKTLQTRTDDLIIDVEDLAEKLADLRPHPRIVSAAKDLARLLALNKGSINVLFDKATNTVQSSTDALLDASTALQQRQSMYIGVSISAAKNVAALLEESERWTSEVARVRERVAVLLPDSPGTTADQLMEKIYPHRKAIIEQLELAKSAINAARKLQMKSNSRSPASLREVCNNLESSRLECMQLLVDTRGTKSEAWIDQVVDTFEGVRSVAESSSALAQQLREEEAKCAEDTSKIELVPQRMDSNPVFKSSVAAPRAQRGGRRQVRPRSPSDVDDTQQDREDDTPPQKRARKEAEPTAQPGSRWRTLTNPDDVLSSSASDEDNRNGVDGGAEDDVSPAWVSSTLLNRIRQRRDMQNSGNAGDITFSADDQSAPKPSKKRSTRKH